MSEPHNCENGGCLMDEFCCHDVANLQARLARCEGEKDGAKRRASQYGIERDTARDDRDAAWVAANQVTNERDAALERVKVLEEKLSEKESL